jgi:hypothetical protein
MRPWTHGRIENRGRLVDAFGDMELLDIMGAVWLLLAGTGITLCHAAARADQRQQRRR